MHVVSLSLTPLYFAICYCIVLPHFYCKIFFKISKYLLSRDKIWRLLWTCFFLAFGTIFAIVRFSSETPQLYFEKPLRLSGEIIVHVNQGFISDESHAFAPFQAKINWSFMLRFVLWLAYLIDSSKVIKVGGKQKPYKMWQAGISLAASPLANSLAGEAREVIWWLRSPAHESRQLRRLRYTRICYTLWLVNFDRFCQHSSITDADEIYNRAAVRDLSTSNAVFKSVINNTLKDFPKWSAFAKIRRIAWKYGQSQIPLQSFPPVLERV